MPLVLPLLGDREPEHVAVEVERLVDVGATVHQGQVIARLDPADYRLAVDNARAALASAEADWQRAKADHERYQALRNTAAYMAQTMETRQSAAMTAQARVDQARSQLATAENNLAYTVLHADATGVVTAVMAEVGQVMAQGQGVVKVARTDELEILVGVPENRLAAMRQVPEATFELWSDKGKKYAARLRELSPSADPVTRTYPARFTVVERPAFIGLGMTATLTFERADLIVVSPGVPVDQDVFQLALDFITLLILRNGIDQNSLRVAEIDRGLMEATYLIDVELPEDKVTRNQRSALTLNHTFTHEKLVGGLNVNKVSDDSYFRDLSSRINLTAQTNLLREGLVNYSGNWWESGTYGATVRIHTIRGAGYLMDVAKAGAAGMHDPQRLAVAFDTVLA